MKIFPCYFCPGVTNSSVSQGLGERVLTQLKDFKRLSIHKTR